jgi:hypothetical protein
MNRKARAPRRTIDVNVEEAVAERTRNRVHHVVGRIDTKTSPFMSGQLILPQP